MSTKESLVIELFTRWAFLFFVASQVFFQNTIINRLAMVMLVGMVFLLCVTKKRLFFHSYFLFALLLIIQSYLYSVNGVSINSSTSLAMTTTLGINFIIALSIYNYILIHDNLEKSLFSFAKIGTVFVIVISLLSIISGGIFNGRLGQNINFQILGDSISYNANSIALIAGFSYLIYIYKYNNTKKLLNIFLMLIFILIIMLTGSRKGFLFLILGTPLLVLMLSPKKWLRNVYMIIVLLFGFYLISMKIPALYNIIGFRIEALITQLLGADVQDASTETRSLYVERGWEYFLLKPWTGYGLDTFRHLPGSYGTYSHNNYIELLVSGGIISFIIYYVIRFFVLMKLFLNLRGNNLVKLMFVFILVLLLLDYGLVSYYERIYTVIFIFVLCALSLIKVKK